MARGLPAWTLVTILALAGACGKRAAEPEEAPPPAPAIPAPDTAAAVEVDTPDTLFVAVDLPEAFPADFPIAPESTVVEARSARDGDGGDLSQITLVTRGRSDELVAWYHDALEAAGWQVTAGEGRGGAATLHGTQAESYIDLAIQIHPELEGWLVTTAEIWKTAL